MTQGQFNEIVNTAATFAAEDMTNDFYTILDSLIEEVEPEDGQDSPTVLQGCSRSE